MITTALALVVAIAGPATAQEPQLVPGQVLVKVTPTGRAPLEAHLAGRLDTVELRRAIPYLNPAKVNRVGLDRILVLGVPAGEEGLLADELAALQAVEWASVNSREGGITGGSLLPNDPFFVDQWALDQPNDIDMDIPEAWALRGTTEAANLLVAVVDTGFDTWTSQADWEGVVWENPVESRDGIDNDGNGLVDDVYGWDYDEDDWIPQAVHPHGVNTGGEIAAITDNGEQVAGVASGVSVMPLKSFNPLGNFPTSGPYAGHLSAAAAITYAADHDADIINNSWFNGDDPSLVINDSIQYALDNGLVIFFAAANCGDSNAWPAEHPDVTAVAAIDSNGKRSVWGIQASNYGPWVDVAAGGTAIATTENLGGVTTTFAGTSAACPLAVGLACLLLSEEPELSNADVRELLQEGAINIDSLNPGFEGLLGSGHVNALNSLELVADHADAGGALAGDFAPVLNTWGHTAQGDEVTVSVHAGPPSSPALLIFGFSEANLPLLGGVLVPAIDAHLVGTTGANGTLHVEFALPSALAPGPALWIQFIAVDAGAPAGVDFSNARVLSGQ